MFNLDLKKLKIDEGGLKAYVNQQMSDISFAMGKTMEININCEQIEDKYKTVMTFQHSLGELRAEGLDDSIFDSIRKAKESLIMGVFDIEEALNPQIRNQKINQYSKGTHWLH